MWLERYANRYRWAYDAYQRFISEIDPSLAGDVSFSSHVTIAVYGATQVGKTTLILDLLGLTGEALTRASGVLRGTQRTGKSSTACAIRYGRSPDDSWYIGDDSGPLNDAAAERQFAAIRAALENGRAQLIDVLPVLLPSELFDQGGDDALALSLRILDIPGINAVNQAEQEHVACIAEKYVATADLILLVGRADNLGFLHPNSLKLEALSDWMLQPNRYRVVLSYTFSPASFKTWFGQAPRTVGQVRAKLYHELGTHDYKPPESVEAMLFPLEFGDSLGGLTDAPAYHQAAVGLIRQLRSELLASITASVSPYGRLASAFKMKALIEAKNQRENSDYDDRKKIVEHELQSAQDALTRIGDLLTEWRKETDFLNHQHNELCQDMTLDRCNDLRQHFTLPWIEIHKSVSSLKSAAVSFEDRIQEKWRRLYAEFPHFGTDFWRTEIPPPNTSALDGFYQKMNDYWTDSYWSDKNFNSDLRMLQQATEKISDAYIHATKNEIQKYFQRKRDDLKKKQQNHDRQLESLQTTFAKHQQAVLDLHARRDQIEQSHQQFEARMQRSMAHSKKFEQYIFESFLVELNRAKESIRHPANAIEQFYDIFYLHMLPGELDKMLTGKTF